MTTEEQLAGILGEGTTPEASPVPETTDIVPQVSGIPPQAEEEVTPIRIDVTGGRDRPTISPYEIQPAGQVQNTLIDEDEIEVDLSTPTSREAQDAAIEQQWMFGFDEYDRLGDDFPPDPNFQWTHELYSELTKDLPEDVWDAFDEADSEAEARAIREQVQRDLKNQEIMNRYGASHGIAAQIALSLEAAMTDPAAIALTAGTAGLAAPLFAGTKLSKLWKAIALTGVGVSTDLAIESAVIANDATQNWDQLLYAGAASLGLNAVIARSLMKRGYFDPAKYEPLNIKYKITTDDAKTYLDAIMQGKEPVKLDLTLGEESLRNIEEHFNKNWEFFREGARQAGQHLKSPEEFGRVLLDAEGRSFFEQEGLEDLVIRQSMGAARTNADEIIDEGAEAFGSFVGDYYKPSGALDKARIDTMGIALRSDEPTIRYLADILGEDAVGRADRSISPFGAIEYKLRTSYTHETDWNKVFNPAYREWAIDNGYNPRANQASVGREQFDRLVDEYIRIEGTPAGVGRQWHPAVVRAGEHARSWYNRYGTEARDLGVAGFEDFTPNANYSPRMYNHRAIGELNRRFGTAQIDEVFANAFKRANDWADDVIALRVGKAMHNKLRRVGVSLDTNAVRPIAKDDRKALANYLADTTDLSQDEIGQIVSKLKVKGEKGISRARSRTTLDEATALKLKPIDGGPEEVVRLRDMFENRASVLAKRYNFALSGQNAMAKVGFRSESSFNTALDHARVLAAQKGIDPETTSGEIGRLIDMHNAITGKPRVLWDGGVNPYSTWQGQLTQRLGELNFMRLMGGMWWSMFPDLARSIGTAGVRATLRIIPDIKYLIRDVRTGKLKGETANQLEDLVGLGTDYLNSATFSRFNEFSDEFMPPYSATGNKFARGLERLGDTSAKGIHWMNKWSGNYAMQTAMDRMALSTLSGRLSRMSVGLAKKWSPQRLANIGLDQQMLDRFGDQIRKHGQWKDGKLLSIHIDRWDDIDAAETYAMSLNRVHRNAVQRTDPTSLPKWMGKGPIAKIIGQFKTFMMGAHGKQLLHDMRLMAKGDPEAFKTFLITMGFATVIHIARSYVSSIGMSEELREDYLSSQLSPLGIALGAFSKAGIAATVPFLVDTAASLFGMPKPFSGFSHQGSASEALLGNPTSQLIEKAGAVPGKFEDGLTEKELRAILMLIPFQNMIGIQQGLNLAANYFGTD